MDDSAKRKKLCMTSYNSNFGEYPKPKKSKTSKETTSHWSHLPSVLLHDIFSLLNKEDRKNVSAVCKHWRQNSFHSKWWQSVTFKIEPSEIEKAVFLKNTFGKIVRNVRVRLNTLSSECVLEFIKLLELLKENNILNSILLEPSHCRLEGPSDQRNEEELWGIVGLLNAYLPKLTQFSIGCLEDLSYFIEDIIKTLDPCKVTHLGLASVKDDPMKYQPSCFTPSLIRPFKHLKILSIDYDQLSDDFLSQLDGAKQLERLVVHLHSIRIDHPGTTDDAWSSFRVQHPNCEFRLTVIHAFNDIASLHETVLRSKMPLSHLKVFFCEKVNLEVIQVLTIYAETLRSIMWIDSLSNNDNSWIFVKPIFDESPDPFVLLAWLCKHLEEFIIYGYKYPLDNLIAIARLRSDTLKKLEVVETDIICNTRKIYNEFWDIPIINQIQWKPCQLYELHPVICNPTDGDSDEYIIPIVLADIQ